MTTIQEIVNYTNNLIQTQEIRGFAYERDTGHKIALRVTGQFSQANLEHLLNQFTELTSFWIEDFAGFMEIIYIYGE